jgi:hypothetical protein
VEVNKNRVNITEMEPTDINGSALTGGYFIEVDAYAYDEISWFNSNKGNPVTIKSPADDEIVPEQSAYIKDYFNKMEANWIQYLDLNTFLRHFLVGELSGNTDTYWSVYMYKDRDSDIIYTGPVWDFDIAFENDYRTFPINSKSDFIYRSGGSCAGNMKDFVDRIVVYNANARKQLYDIWDEVRQKGLTEESLSATIDAYAEELQQSQQLNFLRWPILNQNVHMNPQALGSYAAEVENVRKFLKERVAWIDKKFGYTYVNAIEGVMEHTSAAINGNLPYDVFSLSGQLAGHDMNALPQGIYIVRQGQTTRRITIK